MQEIRNGRAGDADHSSMRNPPLAPLAPAPGHPHGGLRRRGGAPASRCPRQQTPRAPFQTLGKFDSEFRNGLGYHQPAGALASVGRHGRGHPARRSPSTWPAARRPVYIAENCTQCMECITACPDTALPNMAQDVGTVLKTAVNNYVTDMRTERAKSAPSSPGSKSVPGRR